MDIDFGLAVMAVQGNASIPTYFLIAVLALKIPSFFMSVVAWCSVMTWVRGARGANAPLLRARFHLGIVSTLGMLVTVCAGVAVYAQAKPGLNSGTTFGIALLAMAPYTLCEALFTFRTIGPMAKSAMAAAGTGNTDLKDLDNNTNNINNNNRQGTPIISVISDVRK